jgi:large subunit ribosomal protein L25
MEATLKAVPREGRGKNEARRLRTTGQVPAIVYGGPSPAASVAVEAKPLLRIMHSESGANTLIALQLDGGEMTRVILKDFLLDPVSHRLLHADFYRVAMDKAITVTVPVEVQGESKGVKVQGGVLDLPHREVQIECLPGEIPEHLVVDVSELLIGQSVRLRDLAVDARWSPVSDPETMLVHVVAARTTAETPAAETAAPTAPAEPEVIKKGKTDKPAEG